MVGKAATSVGRGRRALAISPWPHPREAGRPESIATLNDDR
jgi:hypothetical protein